MLPSLYLLTVACTGLITGSFAQVDQTSNCPNNFAFYNFNERTLCTNGTYFIVPVATALVTAAVSPYTLLPLPTTDKTLFPNGFPAGKHPVVVQSGLESDIRMNTLQLAKFLFGGSIVVPYVDRLGDKKSPFRFSVKSYLGGLNDDDVNALVPTIVGSAGGTTLFVANFVPNNQAYQAISGTPEYIAQIKQVVVPNPVSGPGVYPEASDFDFFPTTSPKYPLKLFKRVINQPLILTNGFCQRNPIFFNETFSNPLLRRGKVTLQEPGGAFQGVYTDQDGIGGLSAAGGNVGFAMETCDSANGKVVPNQY